MKKTIKMKKTDKPEIVNFMEAGTCTECGKNVKPDWSPVEDKCKAICLNCGKTYIYDFFLNEITMWEHCEISKKIAKMEFKDKRTEAEKKAALTKLMKDEIKNKGWKIKEVAERWSVTPRRMSQILGDPSRMNIDAIYGLPKNGIMK